VAAKDAELGTLTTAKDGALEQQRQMREARDSIQAEAERLKTQIDELKRSGDKMQGELTKIASTLGDYNNTIKQLDEQKTAALEKRAEAERARDAALSEKQAAELAQSESDEATRNANLKIGDLEGEKVALTEKVSQLETRVQMVYAKTGIRADEIEAQKPIDALVLSVDKGLKLVILNKGKKDEVKQGYVFEIYRGSQYTGQVKVQDVQDGMCSGQIINEKSAITSGDSATTTL
jgi:chromosome segregation ATPase